MNDVSGRRISLGAHCPPILRFIDIAQRHFGIIHQRPWVFIARVIEFFFLFICFFAFFGHDRLL